MPSLKYSPQSSRVMTSSSLRAGANPPRRNRVGVFNHAVMLTDQTVDSNDKLIAIHWETPSVNSRCGNLYSTKKGPNGSAARKSCGH